MDCDGGNGVLTPGSSVSSDRRGVARCRRKGCRLGSCGDIRPSEHGDAAMKASEKHGEVMLRR